MGRFSPERLIAWATMLLMLWSFAGVPLVAAGTADPPLPAVGKTVLSIPSDTPDRHQTSCRCQQCAGEKSCCCLLTHRSPAPEGNKPAKRPLLLRSLCDRAADAVFPFVWSIAVLPGGYSSTALPRFPVSASYRPESHMLIPALPASPPLPPPRIS